MVGFFATTSTEGEVLYELAKTAINKLDLRFENIIAECFDGAANMSGSTKRYAFFKDIKVHEEDVTLTLTSLSTTRWSCRWAAVRAVLEQVPRIMEALVTLSKDRDPKTYNESNLLLHSICDFEFVYGLMVLKLILSNTNNLSRYLQGEQMDVITAKKTADAVVKTLSNCRNEESFTQM